MQSLSGISLLKVIFTAIPLVCQCGQTGRCRKVFEMQAALGKVLTALWWWIWTLQFLHFLFSSFLLLPLLLLKVMVVWVSADPLLSCRVLHRLAHVRGVHVADALERVREVGADLKEGRKERNMMQD
jgi:hypothetical protein